MFFQKLFLLLLLLLVLLLQFVYHRTPNPPLVRGPVSRYSPFPAITLSRSSARVPALSPETGSYRAQAPNNLGPATATAHAPAHPTTTTTTTTTTATATATATATLFLSSSSSFSSSSYLYSFLCRSAVRTGKTTTTTCLHVFHAQMPAVIFKSLLFTLFMLMLGLFVFLCHRNRTTLKVNYLHDIYKRDNSRASTHDVLDIVSPFATKSLNSEA